MGFRCPNCHIDFGDGNYGFKKLQKHFSDNPECRAETYVHTDLFLKSIGINKKKVDSEREHRQYSHVSDRHVWQKINVVTNPDGSDTVKCKRCGLKAKRYVDSFKFDMRQIYKIENCVGDK